MSVAAAGRGRKGGVAGQGPRGVAGLCALALLAAACGREITPPATAPASPAPEPALPLTGHPAPGMESYDRIIPALMKEWGISGGAVAVARNGRLVLARGYGYADRARNPVPPDALFRIASVSKPITAVAVLRLHEEGRLDLDARAFALLRDATPPAGATPDPRLAGVTVRQLLHHSAGWDRQVTFDPMFRSTQIADALGLPPPASVGAVIRYMLGRPLDFDPGARYAYSNFGYAVLGRVIEQVSGERYEEYVRRAVLAPAGARGMRLGRSLLAERAPGEVEYFDPATGPSVFAPGTQVALPYGGFHLEAMDSHGGWLASAPDLLRFLTAVDDLPTRPDILRPATLRLMVARPPAPLWEASPYHYGLGWLVRPAQGNWWHDGSLPGTTALLVRTGGGLAWAALFNARQSGRGSSFAAELDAALWSAASAVTAWPDHDLFATH